MSRISIIFLVAVFLGSCTSTNPSQEKIATPDTTQLSIEVTDSVTNTADTSTFQWDTELCQNKGTYLTKQYSEAQLKDTYTLWSASSLLSTSATVFKPQDIGQLDQNTTKLEKEYADKRKQLEQLNPIQTPYWVKLKKARLQELDEDYQLRKLTLEANRNPSVLLNSKYAEGCRKYAEALASTDSTQILETWKAMAEEQKKNNGSPEQYMKIFYNKYNSSDKLDYAKVEIMTFGWWNCCNMQLNRVSQDMAMEVEFNKLFTNVQSQCDEP